MLRRRSFDFIWKIPCSHLGAPAVTQSNFGFPSLLSLVITASGFMASTNMKLADRAGVDIVVKTSEKLKNVIAEEKMTEWWKSNATSSTPIGGHCVENCKSSFVQHFSSWSSWRIWDSWQIKRRSLKALTKAQRGTLRMNLIKAPLQGDIRDSNISDCMENIKQTEQRE